MYPIGPLLVFCPLSLFSLILYQISQHSPTCLKALPVMKVNPLMIIDLACKIYPLCAGLLDTVLHTSYHPAHPSRSGHIVVYQDQPVWDLQSFRPTIKTKNGQAAAAYEGVIRRLHWHQTSGARARYVAPPHHDSWFYLGTQVFLGRHQQMMLSIIRASILPHVRMNACTYSDAS